MRIGVLADVHANLPALRAVLSLLDERGVDRLVVAGDLVGYGGQPDECVTLLAEAGAQCVLGNHDLFVLDRLPPTRFPEVARRSADVTRRLLTADARRFLESLPLVSRAGRTLVAHGSLDDPEEYVLEERRARELLDRLPSVAPGAETLVLGHTHEQWCFSAAAGTLPTRVTRLPEGPRLVNPGSVGQSREWERRPRARFAIYDDDDGVVDFLRLDYDVAAGREALRRHGLPDRCLHAPLKAHWMALRVFRRAIRGQHPTR